jgi:3(or 17)beta-hydroxysteroid dehydrogenase
LTAAAGAGKSGTSREARAEEAEMTDRLAGKVALITGGASGLGANAAALMVQEGARVVVADIAADRGKAVADRLGSAGHFVKLDVTSEDNWQAVIAETVGKFGALHVLLNSAGIGLSKTVEDITLEEWRRVHAIDLDGVFLGCKHGVAEIKKHTQKLGGSVINISSISGIIAGANMAAYNSAKAGVRLLSKSVALHCAKSGYNIRCNSVHPTFIDTPILDKYRDRFGNDVMQQKLGRQVPIGRLGRPEEVGWALVFLASDESSFMTGSEVVIDGGISAM